MDFTGKYQAIIAYLFAQFPQYQNVGKIAYKEGLDNMQALDALLEYPHQNFMSVHVAGTNGKGSVCHMMASVLQRAGYRTGLYTSPHLIDFRERIRINGKMIPKEEVLHFIERYRERFDEIRPSFFEITTAMAFYYFARQKVDIAVIETGLGGRLDATNLITPTISVITNIGLDHCEHLGNTLTAIATEKAGIIKAHVPVVVGEHHPDTDPIFIGRAKELQATLYFAEDGFKVESSCITEGRQRFVMAEEGAIWPNVYELDLLGSYQKKNIVTTLMTVSVLKRFHKIAENQKWNHRWTVEHALAETAVATGLRGRWEYLSQKPKIITDTAHNAPGLSWVCKQLREESYKRLHFIFGVVVEKDIEAILPLLPKDAYYYFTQAHIPRAMDARLLAEQCLNEGLKGQIVDNVAIALSVARANAGPHDLVFVGGSTFVVAEVLEVMQKEFNMDRK